MHGRRNLPDGVEMSFRPATADDLAFCYRAYADGLRDHVDTLFGWNEADQQRNFAAAFRPDEARIICGRIEAVRAEVGWMQVEIDGDSLHVKELHIVSGSRGLGLGGWALAQAIAEAAAHGKDVRLSALTASPALRFYSRFGFETVGRDNHMIRLRRRTTA